MPWSHSVSVMLAHLKKQILTGLPTDGLVVQTEDPGLAFGNETSVLAVDSCSGLEVPVVSVPPHVLRHTTGARDVGRPGSRMGKTAELQYPQLAAEIPGTPFFAGVLHIIMGAWFIYVEATFCHCYYPHGGCNKNVHDHLGWTTYRQIDYWLRRWTASPDVTWGVPLATCGS